ncbi:MAG: hypothetical protein ACREAW_00170 [Nitrososphaera sp.]
MAQASKVDHDRTWCAIEKSLDVLGGSKELVLYPLSEMGTDLSSSEDIEQAMTQLLGEGAQIIIAPVLGQLQK